MTGTRSSIGLAVLVFLLASIVAVSTWAADGASHRHTAQAKPAVPTKPATPGAPKVSRKSPAAEYTPTVRFRLRTELAEGKMAFVGAGGDIEGVVNPTLRVARRRRRPGHPHQQRRHRARRRVPRLQRRAPTASIARAPAA